MRTINLFILSLLENLPMWNTKKKQNAMCIYITYFSQPTKMKNKKARGMAYILHSLQGGW